MTAKRNRRSARRRVRTRTALFLCIFSAVCLLLQGAAARAAGGTARVWLSAAGSALCFALPAYVGLCAADGDQRHLLQLRRLSGAQMLWLAVAGALTVCPATLLGDVVEALPRAFGLAGGAAPGAGSGAWDAALLLATLLGSGVIAPLCEEVFFRGYLLGVFSRYGRLEAALLTAALFAAAHGISSMTLAYFLMGLLFAALELKTGSLLAPVIAHMAYNIALTLLAVTPAAALFTGLSPVSGAVRLCGCAALSYALGRAWKARGARGTQENAAFSRREKALMIAAPALVLVAQILAEVTGL